MNPFHTSPALLARTIEGFSAGVSLEPSAELAIQLKRDGYAFGRVKRDAPPIVHFPEVDQRRTERRIFDRRSMQDVLDRRAKRPEGAPLSLFGSLL